MSYVVEQIQLEDHHQQLEVEEQLLRQKTLIHFPNSQKKEIHILLLHHRKIVQIPSVVMEKYYEKTFLLTMFFIEKVGSLLETVGHAQLMTKESLLMT
jgi:hypothetical protein